MANFFPAILFLLVVCIPVHVQARESEFFSKFTANADTKDANTDTAVNRVGPTKEQPEFLDKHAQDPPAFVAESRNGYGLYGHETGQLPNSNVDTTTSFGDEPYYNKERNYAGFYDKDTYAKDKEIARDTNAMLQGSSYTTAENSKNNNNNYFSAEEQRFRNTAVNGQNNYYMGGNRNRYTANGNKVQQQGMSDTRFLENGKYYHNIDDEEKYNPTRYAKPRNVEFDSNQGYLPNANRNNNYDNGKEYKGNYYADNYAAENAKVMAGGYDPVKNQYVFRPTKNDDEFMP